MEVLAQDENKKYNDEYDKFIKSIRSEDLANYSDFIESIANSKLFWDKYIASECRAEGLLNIKTLLPTILHIVSVWLKLTESG